MTKLVPLIGAVVCLQVCGSVAADDVGRERIPSRDKASQDALEGKPPPVIHAARWIQPESGPPAISALEGKVVLVRVWATWCGPCRKSVPAVKRLYDKHKENGFTIVSVHTTRGGERADTFVKKHEIPWAVAVDDADKTAELWGALAGKPDYYLIDRRGILRFADIKNTDLERAVTLLMDEVER